MGFDDSLSESTKILNDRFGESLRVGGTIGLEIQSTSGKVPAQLGLFDLLVLATVAVGRLSNTR